VKEHESFGKCGPGRILSSLFPIKRRQEYRLVGARNRPVWIPRREKRFLNAVGALADEGISGVVRGVFALYNKTIPCGVSTAGGPVSGNPLSLLPGRELSGFRFCPPADANG